MSFGRTDKSIAGLLQLVTHTHRCSLGAATEKPKERKKRERNGPPIVVYYRVPGAPLHIFKAQYAMWAPAKASVHAAYF